jgi:hypothetical protein
MEVHTMLELSVALDTISRRIEITVQNTSEESIVIGNLALTNVKFRNVDAASPPVVSWISCHIPNADGTRVLAKGEAATIVIT